MYKYIAMSKNIKYSITFLMFLFAFAGTKPVFAKDIEQAMTISPIVQDVSLTPGQPTSYTLTITNTADLPLGIHADVTGFTEDTITGVAHFASTDSPMIDWTTLSTQDLTLSPHSSQQITVTITPPYTINIGGYYTAIFFTPFISKPDHGGPIVLSRIGALILGTYGDISYENLSKKVAINDFSLQQRDALLTTTFTVSNHYFTHFTAKPFLILKPLWGKPTTYPLSEKHILPSKTKLWSEPVAKNTFFIGQAVLNVSVGQGNYATASTFVVILPWQPILVISSLLILFIITILLRKRLMKSFTIILKGR